MRGEALGGGPAPGDVVRRVATLFEKVVSRAEVIESRLGYLEAGTGPDVWRGQAADMFHRLLGEVGPDLTRLATSHEVARDALNRYAAALAAAQDLARRAAIDACAAIADLERASADRTRATAEVDQQSAAAAQADRQLADLTVQRISTADPVHQASLTPHVHRVEAARLHAAGRVAEARHRRRAAEAVAADAEARLAAARRLVADAAGDHDVAARVAADVLEAASRAGSQNRGVIARLHSNGEGAAEFGVVPPPNPSWSRILTEAQRERKRQLSGTPPGPDDPAYRNDIRSVPAGSASWQAALYEQSVAVSGRDGEASACLRGLAVAGAASAAIGSFGQGRHGAKGDVSARAALVEAGATARWVNGRFGGSAQGKGAVPADADAGPDLSVGPNGARVGGAASAFAGVEADATNGADLGGFRPSVTAEAQAGIGASAGFGGGFQDGTFSFGGGAGLAIGVGGKVGGGFEVDVPEIADDIGDGVGWAGRKIGDLL